MSQKNSLIILIVIILLGVGGFAYYRSSKKIGSVKSDTETPEMMTVKIFVPNTKLDPNALTCSKVFPLTRVIPKTVSVAKASIEELIKGVTDVEKADGYHTLIHPSVILKSISIKGGIAYPDFDQELERSSGGSCAGGMIAAEIIQTLRQFPSVKDVVISIEGRSGDVILQP